MKANFKSLIQLSEMDLEKVSGGHSTDDSESDEDICGVFKCLSCSQGISYGASSFLRDDNGRPIGYICDRCLMFFLLINCNVGV